MAINRMNPGGRPPRGGPTDPSENPPPPESGGNEPGGGGGGPGPPGGTPKIGPIKIPKLTSHVHFGHPPPRTHGFYYNPPKTTWPPPETKPEPPGPPAPPPVYTKREQTVMAKGDCYPIIYGTVRCGGKIVFYKTDLSQTQLVVDILVCEGPVQAIRDIRFGDYTPEQLGCVLNTSYYIYLGTNNQGVDPLCSNVEPLYASGKPGTAHVTFKFDGNLVWAASKVNVESFKCTVDGMKIRDPRQDATLVNRYFSENNAGYNNALATIDLLTNARYGGGFPDDQFDWISGDPTHSWADAANDCDYVIASRGSGPASAPTITEGPYGSGKFNQGESCTFVYTFVTDGVESLASPASATFQPTTNYVRAQVAIGVNTGPGTTTERRIYRSKKEGTVTDTDRYLVGSVRDNSTTVFWDLTADYELQPTKAPQSASPTRYRIGLYMGDQKSLGDWLEIIRATYMANFNYDGKIHVWIDKARSDSGIVFDKSNIIGDIEIATTGLKQMFAKVKGKYVNADAGFKDDEASAEVSQLAQPPTENEREEKRIGDYDMTAVPSYDQTMRLLKQILNKSRLTRQITFRVMYRGLRLMPGMVVLVTHDTGPLVQAKVVVTGIKILPEGPIQISGEFYDPNIYSDAVQSNPSPLLPPQPSAGVIPPPPTSCSVTEIITVGGSGSSSSRLKVTFTPAVSAFSLKTRITVNNGLDTITAYEVESGPVYVENPRMNVEHTIVLATMGVYGQLSAPVTLTITPGGPAGPSSPFGLAEDALKVLRLASSARHYIWDYFLRVIWGPVTDAKLYRLRWSNVLTDGWDQMTKEMIIPAERREQIMARPSAITGLKLWLKAEDLAASVSDGNPVYSWPDASGHNNPATVALYPPAFKAAVLNGRPAVRFNGSSQYLRCAYTPGFTDTSGFTYFMVLNPVTTPGTTAYALDRSPAGNPIVSIGSWSDGNYFGQWRDDAGSNLISPVSTVPVTAGIPRIVCWSRERGVKFRLFIDGTVAADPVDNFATYSCTPPPPQLGLRGDQAAGMNVDIAELIIFDHYLSSTELDAMHEYLKAKYGIGSLASVTTGSPSETVIRADLSPVICRDRTEVWEAGVGSAADTLIDSFDNFYGYNVIVRPETYAGVLGTAAQIKRVASTAGFSGGTPPPYVPQISETKTLSNGLNSNISISGTSGAVTAAGPTAAFSIGGFTGGAAGRWMMFFNSTTQAVTIINEDTSSTAANRINTITGGDVALSAKAIAIFYYDIGSARWVLSLASDQLGASTSRGINTQLFTSGGTFTVPLGVTKVYLTGCAAGGGGGGHASSGLGTGGGGGAGDAILRKDISVTPGQQITVTIGTGGNGATAGNQGSTGGTTSFGSLFSLTGGAGGYSGSGSANGAGGASGGPGGAYGGMSGDTTGNFGGAGGGTMVGAAQMFHGSNYQSPFGAGGVGGYGSANGCKGGDGFLYVEW